MTTLRSGSSGKAAGVTLNQPSLGITRVPRKPLSRPSAHTTAGSQPKERGTLKTLISKGNSPAGLIRNARIQPEKDVSAGEGCSDTPVCNRIEGPWRRSLLLLEHKAVERNIVPRIRA